jgi:8-oxo-dGTP diphosphatase
MTARDGDGWVQCRCGGKHWGLNGAAGLMLIRDRKIMMQHRAPWVHNGDTWGLPGGARDSHESVSEAAIRESVEETGIKAEHVQVVELFSDDHIDWRYDTVIAKAHGDLKTSEWNTETHDIGWFEISEIQNLELHPSFAKTWPTLQILVSDLIVSGSL